MCQTGRLRVREPRLRIALEQLPPAAPGIPYQSALEHEGGLNPISWSAEGLPEGLTVSGAAITGTLHPQYQEFGLHEVRLQATDAADPPQVALRTVKLAVVPLLPATTVASGRCSRHRRKMSRQRLR